VQVQLATQHESADAVHPAEVGFLTQEFVEIHSSRAQSRAVWSRHQGLTRQTDVDGSAEHLYYDKQQVSRVEHVGCSVDTACGIGRAAATAPFRPAEAGASMSSAVAANSFRSFKLIPLLPVPAHKAQRIMRWSSGVLNFEGCLE